ncbi:MAG TPA: redoxin family protein [Candidatus Limnocylindria bacterium]|nr:redoxin family protein [Candidatus Limnocylindria bacterium]
MTQRSRTSRAPRRDARLHPAERRMPMLWLIVGGVVIVAVVVVLALLLSTANGGTSSGEPARNPVQVSGQALPSLPQSGSDPAVGQKIPTLTGVTFDNSPMTIGPNDGPAVIFILAHWCPHCQAEVPRVQQWIDSGAAPDGVKLLTLTTSISTTRPNYPPSTWLEREHWSPPVLVDDANSTGLSALGMDSFPGFIFVKADGTVLARTTGELPIDQLASLVNELK